MVEPPGRQCDYMASRQISTRDFSSGGVVFFDGYDPSQIFPLVIIIHRSSAFDLGVTLAPG